MLIRLYVNRSAPRQHNPIGGLQKAVCAIAANFNQIVSSRIDLLEIFGIENELNGGEKLKIKFCIFLNLEHDIFFILSMAKFWLFKPKFWENFSLFRRQYVLAGWLSSSPFLLFIFLLLFLSLSSIRIGELVRCAVYCAHIQRNTVYICYRRHKLLNLLLIFIIFFLFLCHVCSYVSLAVLKIVYDILMGSNKHSTHMRYICVNAYDNTFAI